MFGGKKLRDLTEEDIRVYAASLASGGGVSSSALAELDAELEEQTEAGSVPAAAVAAAEPEAPAAVEPGGPGQVGERQGAADIPEGTAGPRAQHLQEAAPASGLRAHASAEDRRSQEAAPAPGLQRQELSEEDRRRQEILTDEGGRSQMPAVQSGDGRLTKTIEHYTFGDTAEAVTISVELDKDLFDGASALLQEGSVEVVFRETEVTVWLRGVPRARDSPVLADWRLHLSPLFHSVDPQGSTWRIRKGKISVKLKKRKKQAWRKVLKF